MATGGQFAIPSLADYKNYYHTDSNTGSIYVTREGHPIELTKELKSQDDLLLVTPEQLWSKRQTRNKTYPPIDNQHLASSTMLNPKDQRGLDHLPLSPIDANTTVIENNGKQFTQDQITANALTTLMSLLTDSSVSNERKDWAHNKLSSIMAKLDTDDDNDSVDSDSVNDMDRQLKEKNMTLKEKENEIQRLKDELNQQQSSIQQTIEQTLAKQQKEFQDQIQKLNDQRQSETKAFHEQIQTLNATVQQQQQYYANLVNPRPPLYPNTTVPPPLVPLNQSSLNGSLLQEFSATLNMQTQINKHHHLNMAPSYDGKDPKQFYTWLDEVERLSIQYEMPKTEVAQITSRGSVHKYIQELKLQNFGWDTIKVKLRERFSDCTSTAAAQNKLSLLKQDGNSMHEYIAHFSDLLGHAYNAKATDVGTNFLANQFIEGIDETNKYTKNKLREKSGNNLDYYFQEAMRLQHKQEIRAIDFGPNLPTQASECTDINAIRSGPMTCFNCKSPDHLIRDCPEPNNRQQSQSHNRQNNPLENTIEIITQALKSLLNNQNTHGHNKPKQPFYHNRTNPQAKPNFRPNNRFQDNRNQYPKDKGKYQRQFTHTNAVEEHEPLHESNYDPEQEDLISFDPSEDQTKN